MNKLTVQNLNLIREATNNLNGTCPTDSRIWLAISKNHHDLSINVCSFLWKLVHNAHKCSKYWLRIKNYEDHGICQNCNSIKSMQHIIFNCNANGCDHTWNAVKELCSRKCIEWPQGFDLSSIMAPSSKSEPLMKPPDPGQPTSSSLQHQNAPSSYGSYAVKGSSARTTTSETNTSPPGKS